MSETGAGNVPVWIGGAVVAIAAAAGGYWYVNQPVPEEQGRAQPVQNIRTTEAKPAPVAVAPTVQKDEVPKKPAVEDSEPEPEAVKEATPEPVLPRLHEVRLEQDGLAVIAGSANPFAEIILRANGVEIGRASADGSGAFATVAFLDPSPDPRVLSLVALSEGGEEIVSPDELILAPVVVAEAPVEEPDVEEQIAEAEVAETPVPQQEDPASIDEASQSDVVARATDQAVEEPTEDPAEVTDVAEGSIEETGVGQEETSSDSSAQDIDVAVLEHDAASDAKIDDPQEQDVQEEQDVADPVQEVAEQLEIQEDEPTAVEASEDDVAQAAQTETSDPQAETVSQEPSADSAEQDTTSEESTSAEVQIAEIAPSDPEPKPAQEEATQIEPAEEDVAEALEPGADVETDAPQEPAGLTGNGAAEKLASVEASNPEEDAKRAGEPPAPSSVDTQLPKQLETSTAPAAEQVAVAEPAAESEQEQAAQTPVQEEPAPAPESPAPVEQVAILRSNELGVEVIRPATPAPDVMSQVALDAISYSVEGDVQLAGRAQSVAREVRVYLDNQVIAALPVDQSGGWRGALPDVDTGVYTLRLDEVDAEGQVTSRVETPFKREDPEVLEAATKNPDAPVQAVTVQKGNTLWAIARERYGEGLLYVRVFEANRSLIRNPDLIYPGQVFSLPDE